MTNGEHHEDALDGEISFPKFIKLWFAIDAVVALAPPLYWWADGRTATIVGIPAALVYFLAVGLCIASSIVVAEVVSRTDATS